MLKGAQGIAILQRLVGQIRPSPILPPFREWVTEFERVQLSVLPADVHRRIRDAEVQQERFAETRDNVRARDHRVQAVALIGLTAYCSVGDDGRVGSLDELADRCPLGEGIDAPSVDPPGYTTGKLEVASFGEVGRRRRLRESEAKHAVGRIIEETAGIGRERRGWRGLVLHRYPARDNAAGIGDKKRVLFLKRQIEVVGRLQLLGVERLHDGMRIEQAGRGLRIG